MNIDLSSFFTTPDGKEDNSPARSTMGELLASILSQATGIAAAYQPKFWNWATTLAGGAMLILDVVDRDFLEKFIENHPSLPVALQAQLKAQLHPEKDSA